MSKFPVVFFVVAAVFLQNVELKGLTKHQRRQIAKECIRSTGINSLIVDEAVRTANPPENNPMYKQYLTCSYVKQGYQKEQTGEISYDTIRDFLMEFYSLQDANFAVESCRRIQDQGSPEENAFKALQCILENLKALDQNSV